VGVGVLRELPVEPLRIEAQLLCVAPKVLTLQVPLVVEEEVVHLPVAALRGGGLRRFGGGLGVRVYPGEREVPKNESSRSSNSCPSLLTTGRALLV
jgi:hypothetical protein